ncbi:unnamed protein product [Mycena citricolor]|uniref:RING-type E3 ubiquitin transferase n=1 Tax=Mycena citricolor TaxID=2018698 RepID=A0AAD2H3M0_9AGAR|nr:unnamed protein product [Mycena citricolor]
MSSSAADVASGSQTKPESDGTPEVKTEEDSQDLGRGTESAQDGGDDLNGPVSEPSPDVNEHLDAARHSPTLTAPLENTVNDICQQETASSSEPAPEFEPTFLEAADAPDGPSTDTIPDPRAPCKFFLQGACTSGAHCRFKHETDPEPKLQRCLWFPSGNCLKGDACPFSHDLGAASEASENDPRKTQCKFFAAGHCGRGKKCLFLHGDPTNEVCRAFMRGEVCPFGNECRFSHDAEALQSQESNPEEIASGSWWEQENDQSGGWGDTASTWATEGDSKGLRNPGKHLGRRNRLSASSRAEGIAYSSGKDIAKRATDADIDTIETQSQCLSKYAAHPCSSRSRLICEKPVVSKSLSAGEETVESVALRTIYNCSVEFGPGATAHIQNTAFESRTVVLSHFPSGTNVDDLAAFVEPHGTITNRVIRLVGGRLNAYFDLENAQQALTARAHLNGLVIEDKIVAAELECDGKLGGSVHKPGTPRHLKLVWDAPSTIAWAFYRTVSKAKEAAAALDGLTVGERKIVAKYHSQSRGQQDRVPVLLENLPARVSREELTSICEHTGPTSVNPSEPNYTQSPEHDIRTLLEQLGVVTLFEVMPTLPSESKVTAFAEFLSPSTIAKATAYLKGRKHPFLGDRDIKTQAVFFSRYTLPESHFPFGLIRDAVNGCDLGNNVRCYDETRTVCLFHRDSADAAKLRETVQALVLGAEIPFPDPYFSMASSDGPLQRLNDKDPAVFIRCDRRCRALRIWGDRSKAEAQIAKLLKTVNEQRCVLDISDVISHLATGGGGLQSLQAQYGSTKITCDIRSKTLTVLGEQKMRDEVSAAVLSWGLRESLPPGDCMLCRTDPTHPVELPCGHRYCSGCLDILLSPACDFAPYCCDCSAEIPLSLIVACLPPEECERAFEGSLLSLVRSQDDLHFCPFGCPVVFRSADIPSTYYECPECRMQLCARCAQPVHCGTTCP